MFDRAYVQQGVCSPSRNSFLSGRRPDTTQIWNFKGSFRDVLGNAVSSLPGAFKNAGWLTTGMGKVYHPGSPAGGDKALYAPPSCPFLICPHLLFVAGNCKVLLLFACVNAFTLSLTHTHALCFNCLSDRLVRAGRGTYLGRHTSTPTTTQTQSQTLPTTRSRMG